MAAVLARERPHLVGLQEVARWTPAPLAPDGSLGDERVLDDFLPTLLAALDEAGCRYTPHAGQPELLRRDAGVALGVDGRRGANVTLVRDDVEVVGERTAPFGTRHVVATASTEWRSPWCAAGAASSPAGGTALRLVNTHTEAYDARVRDTQRDEVLAAHADTRCPSCSSAT